MLLRVKVWEPDARPEGKQLFKVTVDVVFAKLQLVVVKEAELKETLPKAIEVGKVMVIPPEGGSGSFSSIPKM